MTRQRPEPLSPQQRLDAALRLFDRYGELIDSEDAFCRSLLEPLPQTVCVNQLRVDPDHLRDLFESDGLPAAPLEWCPAGLKLGASARPGRHWGFMAGLFQIQEEAALLPVRLLAPRPGERVLDLCAAPGNKTAQIAVEMGQRGTVIANDQRRNRLAPLRQTIRRLGLVNVQLLARDGQTLALPAASRFDRILVDAPCTCEGTFRKVAVPGPASEDEILRARGVQLRLLRAAFRLLRPGGRLVYSTCTFAPEENECVVAEFMEAVEGQLRILPAQIPGLQLTPGLTQWRGAVFDSALANTVRLWPHHNDTGGFYAAVFERTGGGSESPEAVPSSGEDTWFASRRRHPGDWSAVFTDRFGIPEAALSELMMLEWGKRHWRLVNRDGERLKGVQPESVGLPGIRVHSLPPKPTTAAVLLLGDLAVRNVVELDVERAGLYRRRLDQVLPPERIDRCTGPGYVIVRQSGHSLGMGQLIYDRASPVVTLRSLYPSAWVPTSSD